MFFINKFPLTGEGVRLLVLWQGGVSAHDETPPYTLPMGGNRASPLFPKLRRSCYTINP
jgi:hypothetical protein